MSWNQTPPPRKPKIQQQSWDAGTPTIHLYDPNREFVHENSNVTVASSPPAQRNVKILPKTVNYGKYCMPNPKHQMSDPGTYHMASSSLKSPKSPRSQNNQVFEFELSCTPHNSRSPHKSMAPNRHYYADTSTSDSAPATLSSSIKYDYGAISPQFEGSGK